MGDLAQLDRAVVVNEHAHDLRSQIQKGLGACLKTVIVKASEQDPATPCVEVRAMAMSVIFLFRQEAVAVCRRSVSVQMVPRERLPE